MTREEAIDVLKDILEEATSDEDAVCYVTSEDVKAFNMAIESLSAEQKEEELANDIARRMATIIENEQDMRVILKNASAEPTDIISRAEVLDIIAFKRKLANIDGRILLDETVDRIKALPSAELTLQTPQTYGKSINPSNAEVVADLISRADAIEAVRKKLQDWGGYAFEEHREGLYEATDVLKSLPSAEAVKVAYICDGRKCDADCSDCFRTLDIEHAKDFKLIGSVYYQQESADRPSGEWIPCSERLPEDGQGVIICTDDKRFKDHPVGTCTYEHGRFRTNYHYDISMIAWMPLPKPYCGAKMGSDTR